MFYNIIPSIKIYVLSQFHLKLLFQLAQYLSLLLTSTQHIYASFIYAHILPPSIFFNGNKKMCKFKLSL